MEIMNSETEKPSSDDSSSTSNSQSQRRVGILYDERMCKHSTPDGDHHPENPNRIRAIWNKLQIARIPQRFFLFLFIYFFQIFSILKLSLRFEIVVEICSVFLIYLKVCGFERERSRGQVHFECSLQKTRRFDQEYKLKRV